MILPGTSSAAGKLAAVATLLCLVIAPEPTRAQSAYRAAHTRVAVNPANTLLATASEDKTVRLWQLPAGRLLRTIKVPARPGEHGKLYAVAISPDGKQIAFAGYTGQKNKTTIETRTYFDYEIYVHDLSNGNLLHTLTVPGIVDDLSWSPSGDFLIATASEQLSLNRDDVAVPSDALYLFRTPDYARVDDAPGGYLAALARHDRHGRLIVVGRSGGSFTAQILDSDLRELDSREYGGTPASMSVSPDGSAVAITTLFSQLSVHSTADLSALYDHDFRSQASGPSTGASAARSAVAWSADGLWVYFADRTTCNEGGCAIRKLDARNWTVYTDIRVSPHPVTDLVPLAAGGVAFGTAGPGFGIVDASDRRTLYREQPVPVTRQRSASQPAAAAASTAGEAWTRCHVPGTGPGQTGAFQYVRGKYLYIDQSGVAVLTPRVETADGFAGGLARVRVGGKFGYIDRSGRLAVPAQYEGAGDFSEGRALVHSGDLVGYIDRTGKMVIPAKYADAGPFSAGLARVREEGRSHVGFINVLGETVVPPRFDSATDFHDGLAAVELGDKWGYIDVQGEWVISPRFESALPFSDGLAAVRAGPCASRRCTQIIDTSGAVVISNVQLASDRSGFSEGMAVVLDESTRHVFIDKTGRPTATAFQQATSFAGGLAAVRTEDGKWGYVNTQGELTIRPRYEQTLPFSDGRGPFLEGGLWGYVDQTGQVVIPPRFHRADAFSEGLAAVCVSAEHLASISRRRGQLSVKVAAPGETVAAVPIRKPRPLRLSDADGQRVAALHQSTAQLLAAGRYREALAPALDGLAIVELLLSREDPALIQPLRDLGRIHHILGNYRALAGGRTWHTLHTWREARGFLERALRLVERNTGAQHPDAAALADELSDIHASLGEVNLALDMKQRVRAFALASDGADSRTTLKAANDIRILRVEKLLFHRKNLSDGLPMALDQVRQAEATLGADHVNVARGLSNLAKAYLTSDVGVRGAAVELYERALALYSAAGVNDPQRALSVRAAIARLYIDAREYRRAERDFEMVMRGADSVLGPDDEAVVALSSERGFALRESGQFQAASGFFSRALSFWDARLTSDRRSITDLRRALEDLADNWRFMREYSRAEPLYQRILDSRNQYVVMNWSIAARVLRKLGTSQRLRGDLAAAKRTFEQALDLAAPHLSSGAKGRGWNLADDISSEVLQELSAVAAATDPSATAGYLRRAAPMDDRNFWFFASDRTMLDQRSDRVRSRFYHQLLKTTVRHSRADPESIARAYDLVLDRKSVALDLQALAKSTSPPASDRARQDLEELAQVRNDLARTLVRRPAAQTPAQYAETVTVLFERAVALQAEVAIVPAWQFAGARRRVTLSQVAAGLPRDTALIEFVRVRDEDPAPCLCDSADDQAIYLAFVLTPAGALSLADLGPARAIDLLAGDLQAALRAGANLTLTSDVLRELYRLIWAPLEPSLRGVRQTVISPDGELYRVPFAALVDGDDRFLIERFRFAYAATGRDLATSTRTGAVAALDLAVFADPHFGIGGAYAQLPGTAVEAERIPALVRGDKPRQVLRGSDATETSFKHLPPARILHIATHGFFLDRETFGLEADRNEHALVRSGLALAGANRPDQPTGIDDGLLTALEVSGIDLSATELVVLSSCDSGTGSVVQGQGVLGLRRAFLLAGAQNVLMSLWPVDDDTTSQMMVSFYRNLTTLSKAEALHQAQLEVIGALRARHGFASPRLWAAFILESATGFAD